MATEPENQEDSGDAPADSETVQTTANSDALKARKRRILIGSQLGDDEDKPRKPGTTTESSASETNPEQAVAGATVTAANVDTVIRTQTSEVPTEKAAAADSETDEAVESVLPADNPPPAANVDQEVDQLLGDVSMEDLMAGQSVDDELELESRVKATVNKVHNENVFFNLKGRFEGVASSKLFKSPPEPGTMLDVIVKSYNRDDGLYEVAIPGASVDVADWSDLNEGAIVEVRITGSNTGGLECVINNIRGFIPASQIEIFRVDNLNDYINRKLQCIVTEVNPKRKKLVLSHRAIAEREKDELRQKLLETLEKGQTHDGTVTKLMDFGAFVDIGGVEGLVHVSKLSWDRVAHPKDVLKEGEKITVKIEKINQQTGKISLSYRDTQEHPWKDVDQKYPLNSTVSGTVSKLAQFGAFVKLEPGVEGLVHISEIAHHRVMAVKNHLNVGDEVEAKIVSVDPQAQKIGLSIKALVAKPDKPEQQKEKEIDEPLRESAVPKSNQPLKGGTQRKTGGEDFGLKW